MATSCDGGRNCFWCVTCDCYFTVEVTKPPILPLTSFNSPPAFVYGIKKDEQIKEVITFKLKVQERAYQTEYESEENHGTFIPEKGIHEWNDFN